MKAAVLLKLAGLPFQIDTRSLSKAPKGKLPFMTDRDGTIVADSTLIRGYLERTYGIDLSAGLSAEERAIGWAVEKMCEDHLYWGIMHDRWLDDDNFAKGPIHFFDRVPAPVRPVVGRFVRARMRAALKAQGFGRHTAEERDELIRRDITALSTLLGGRPYLFGDGPTGADATVFAFVTGALCPLFKTAARSAAEACPNLVSYRDRLMQRFYPDLGPA